MGKADLKKLGYAIKVTDERKSNDWYTPDIYLNAAIETLGGVDLDPFSSLHANQLVKAKHFYTEQDDAFMKLWGETNPRTVWMNPPYSGALVKSSVIRFLTEFNYGSFEEGIVLVNNATETEWFQAMLDMAHSVCFTSKRISFWNVDGKEISGNTRGQAFFYFRNGQVKGRPTFSKHFKPFGKVIKL